MAIYYIENENGTFLSGDGTRRFMKLSGKAAYAFLQTEEGRKKRFMKTSAHEDGGEEEYVEVTVGCMRKHRKEERREQYVSDCIEESGRITISLYAMEDNDTVDYASGEELIADPDLDVESEVIRKIEIETLRKALKTLTKEEFQLVQELYLSKHPLTVREMGEKLSVHFVTISKRRKAVLKKLKSFFEK